MSPDASPHHTGPADDVGLFDWGLLRGWVTFVLRAPGRHKPLALGCFVAILAMSVAAIAVLPKRWEVQATVLTQRNPLEPGERDWDAPIRVASEIVLRRENLRDLLRETGFVERHFATRSRAAKARDWAYGLLGKSEREPEEVLNDLVEGVASRLWVHTNRDSGTINFGFQWNDRELTLALVDAAVQNFLETRHSMEVSSFAESISILESHASKAQEEISAITRLIDEKERRLRISQGARQRANVRARVPVDADLGRLDAMLVAKRRALDELEDYRRRRLAELQAQLVQQETMYASAHPALVATRNSIDALTRASPQVTSLRGEIADLERNIVTRGGRPGETALVDPGALRGEMAEARLRLEQDDPRLEQERHALLVAFRKYSSLLDRIDGARVALDAAKAGFKYRYVVITPPQLPKAPVSPRRLLVVAAGLLGGIAFAFFACAAVDLRSGIVFDRWQVEHQLGVKVLSELRDRG